jgi:hypothetical protein
MPWGEKAFTWRWDIAGILDCRNRCCVCGSLRDRYGASLPLRILQNAGQVASPAFGLLFSHYTGVLIGATTIRLKHGATNSNLLFFYNPLVTP